MVLRRRKKHFFYFKTVKTNDKFQRFEVVMLHYQGKCKKSCKLQRLNSLPEGSSRARSCSVWQWRRIVVYVLLHDYVNLRVCNLHNPHRTGHIENYNMIVIIYEYEYVKIIYVNCNLSS